MPDERPFDVVLFGATGFTGALTAEYLARHAPEGTRWALAGRSPERLAAVRERLAAIEPACAELELMTADAGDADALRAVAESTQVVVTTVGPYVSYGEPLVAACAPAGTDYVDLTGEPEFVDRMYVRHHARRARPARGSCTRAASTRSRTTSACCSPSSSCPRDVPLDVRGFVRAGGKLSGGTFHSAVERSRAYARPVRRIASAGPSSRGRSARCRRSRTPRATSARSAHGRCRCRRSTRRWSSAPRPRSSATGPTSPTATTPPSSGCPVALGAVGGVGAVFALAQLPPTRSWLLARMKAGDGPSSEQRERSWFKVRFTGEGGGRRVVTEVSGGDPGYGETAKMLAESALCLATDDLPLTAGQVTTAVAMGDALIGRLRGRGITFELLESS